MDHSLVSEAHARSLEVPYMVNEEQEMEELISLGVDAMFTNFPDLLAELAVPDTGGPPLVPLTVASGAFAVCAPGNPRLAPPPPARARLKKPIGLARSLRQSEPNDLRAWNRNSRR